MSDDPDRVTALDCRLTALEDAFLRERDRTGEHLVRLSTAEIEVVLEKLDFGGTIDGGLIWSDVADEGDREHLTRAIAEFERALGHNPDTKRPSSPSSGDF